MATVFVGASPAPTLSVFTPTRSSFLCPRGSTLPRSPPTLHSAFLSPPTSLSFLSSSFSGLSLSVNFNFRPVVGEKRRVLTVRAGKPALCLTKRNRSRKSLARTHGFRRRMRTTNGRAVLKRRRAKGRKVLCTKSYPNSGKGA